MIPDAFKQELLSRVDIVDVIDARVTLKKSGANYSACCPFHTEKTPSFTVSPTKQFYHCFGCGAHGNAISFLMEYGGLGYVEAVKELAESVGMKVPETSAAKRPAAAGPDLHELMEQASDYYREQLKNAPRAIEYLKGRGLEGRTAARFGIGYAPPGWQNLEAVFPSYADKALAECGLVIDNDQGRRYDRFRDRIMFPITNPRGQVIAFGGRVIESDGAGDAPAGPKYLNSPETPLFEKGRELYGLAQAREGIRREGRVIVVEGYMDVVMLAQHGVANAVATLGTATTPVHVQKLLRLADEIVFCFDGDAAGRRAAWHALDISLAELADGKLMRFLFLPPEHDPDSYVREQGRETFEARVREAEPLSEYLLAELKRRNDLRSAEGRSRLVREAAPLLNRIAAPALRLQLVKSVAEAAGMTSGELARVGSLRDIPRVSGSEARRAPQPRTRNSIDRNFERVILRCVLAKPELAARLPAELCALDTLEGQAIAALADAAQAEGAVTGPGALIERFRGAPFEPLLAELLASALESKLDPSAMEVEFAHTLRRFEERQIDRRIEALNLQSVTSGLSPDERDELRRLVEQQGALRQPAKSSPAAI